MRRLNVKFAVILFASVACFAIAVHILHGIQVENSADSLLVDAHSLAEKGDYAAANFKYQLYTQLRPDEKEARVEFAMFLGKSFKPWAELPPDQRNGLERAVSRMETIMRDNADNQELRKLIVDVYMLPQVRDFASALGHLEVLGAGESGASGELQFNYAKCLIATGTTANRDKATGVLQRLVGYKPETDTFEQDKAIDAKNVEAYALLAALVEEANEKDKLALRVLEQGVKVNPDSAEALVARGQYHARNEEWDAARGDMDQALKLKPDDETVMLASVQVDLNRGKLDEAKTQLEAAVKEHPKNSRLYLQLYRLARNNRDMVEARKAIEQGMKENPEDLELVFYKAILQIDESDVESAEKTLAVLSKASRVNGSIVNFLRARIAMAKGDAVYACREFEQVRSALPSDSLRFEVDGYLAACYAVLGRPDIQREALRRRIVANGADVMSRLLMAQSLEANGKLEAAMEQHQKIEELLGEKIWKDRRVWASRLSLMVRMEKLKAESARDWRAVEGFLKGVNEHSELSVFNKAITVIEGYLIPKADFAEARKRLDAVTAAYQKAKDDGLIGPDGSMKKADAEATDGADDVAKSNPTEEGAGDDAEIEKGVDRTAMNLALIDATLLAEEKGASEALERLDAIEKEFGDSFVLRRIQIQMTLRLGDSTVVERLRTIAAGVEESYREPLMRTLASAYQQVGRIDDARAITEELCQADPTNLPLRNQAFELALAEGDFPGAETALAEIERLVGERDSAAIFCSAQLTFSRAGALDAKTDESGRSKLFAETIRLLSNAAQMRPLWYMPPRLLANVYLAQNNYDEALAQIQKAMELGPTDARSAATLVQLHLKNSQISLARETLASLDDALMTTDLRRLKVELELQASNKEAALAQTRDLMTKLEKNEAASAGDYLWYAETLGKLGRQEDAEKACRKAVELAPAEVQTWMALVRMLAQQRKYLDAADVVRQAELALAEDQLSAVMPQFYMMIGKLDLAEQQYLEMLETNPDHYAVHQELAKIYRARGDRNQALRHLNKILSAKDSPETGPPAALRAAARRQAAQIVASGGDYQDFERMLALIKKNYVDGEPDVADLETEVGLLAGRGEPQFKQEAIDKLKAIRTKRGFLPPNLQMQLAALYEQLGDWENAHDEIFNVVEKNSQDQSVLSTFVDMHIRHDDFANAELYLRKLDGMAPGSFGVLRLQSQLLHARGKTDEAVRILAQSLPPERNDSQLPDDRLNMLVVVAQDFERMDRPALAEELYRRFVAVRPNQILALARFLAQQPDPKKVDEAIEICGRNEVVSQLRGFELLPIGIAATGAARDRDQPLTKSQTDAIEGWFQAAERKASNPVGPQMYLALLRDKQSRFDEVTSIYRDLLKRSDVQGVVRSQLRNNLAYVLVLTDGDMKEAAGLVDEAIRQYGPSSDLLDTRAMIHWRKGEFEKALSDAHTAARFDATGDKHFHLALIEKAAGNLSEAADALKTAKSRHFDRKSLPPIERQWFDSLTTATAKEAG